MKPIVWTVYSEIVLSMFTLSRKLAENGHYGIAGKKGHRPKTVGFISSKKGSTHIPVVVFHDESSDIFDLNCSSEVSGLWLVIYF